jgi:hypothetical protein
MPLDVWAAFLFVPPLVKDLSDDSVGLNGGLAKAFEVLRPDLYNIAIALIDRF